MSNLENYTAGTLLTDKYIYTQGEVTARHNPPKRRYDEWDYTIKLTDTENLNADATKLYRWVRISKPFIKRADAPEIGDIVVLRASRTRQRRDWNAPEISPRIVGVIDEE